MMELYPGLAPAQIRKIPSTLRYRLLKGKEAIEKKKRDAEARHNKRRR